MQAVRPTHHPLNCAVAIEGIFDNNATLSRTESHVGFGWTAAPPAAVYRPEFPLPFRESGSSSDILSQPHASSLSPPLWSMTNSFRSRGGLHGLTRDRPLARVSGLPRFDRIAAAVAPMRANYAIETREYPGYRRRPKRLEPIGYMATHRRDSLFLRNSGRKAVTCSVRPVFPDNFGLQRSISSCFPPASARCRRAYLPSQRPSKRERNQISNFEKNKAS